MAYRSSSVNTGSGGADPSTAVPTGAAIGDIVILAVNCDGTGVTNTFPAGFTSFGEQELTLDGQTIEVGWKRLTAADAGSYTIVSNSTLDWVCQAVAFSGRDAELPPERSTTASSSAGNSSPVTISANGVTAVAGDDLCWIGATDRSTNSGTADYTPPTNFTERTDDGGGGLWASMSIATRDNVSAGATGAVDGTVTLSTGTSGWVGWTIRIPEDDGVTLPTLVEAGALLAASAGTTITPVIPASATTDDIMVACYMTSASRTFTTPTGWTVLGTAVESNANQSTKWFWKRHDGSEANPSSTVDAALSSTVGGYGRVYVFRNCITTGDPFVDVTMAGTPTIDNNPDTASIDTTEDNSLVVALVMVDDDNTWSSGMPPSGWTQIGRVASASGGDCMMDGIYKHQLTAGTVTAVTIGTMSANDYWRSITFALLPEPSGATNLVIANASHAHTADNVVLTQVHELTIANATHAHTASNVALVVDLAIQGALHAHTADNLTLTTEASLSIANALHAHTADNLVLTQVHNLVIQDATHAHTADNVVLNVAGSLSINDATHAHSADNVTLTQVHNLVIANASHAHVADNVVLTPGAVNLVIANALHAHTASNVTLTVVYDLTIADALHAHTANSVNLTQTHNLSIANALHLHTADQVTLAASLFRFEPPTHEEPMRTSTKPNTYYRLTWAATVLRSGATFVQQRTPSHEVLEAVGEEGVDWFRGGCVYTIPETVADELVAAGYSVTPL